MYKHGEYARHGDVVLEEVSNLEWEKGDNVKHKGTITLAEGKVTGHSHRIESSTAHLYCDHNGLKTITCLNPTGLSHEEHKTIIIPKGTWRVTIKRQYSPNGWQRVVD